MKILKTIRNGFFETLPPVIFFFIAFVLILATKRMILSEYNISWSGFGAAVVGAMLVGKVVLMVDRLPFIDKFPNRPLIYNTLWKSFIYFLAAFLVRYLMHVVPLLAKHESLMEANRRLMNEIVWPHFWLLQMWLAALFLIFCGMRELVRVIGRDKFIRMFFAGGIHPVKDNGK